MEEENLRAPFPIHDTDDMKDLDKQIKNLEKNQESAKNEYNEIPVAACKFCNDLHILSDELDNDICARCGAVNEVNVFDTIYDYLNFIDEKSDN